MELPLFTLVPTRQGPFTPWQRALPKAWLSHHYFSLVWRSWDSQVLEQIPTCNMPYMQMNSPHGPTQALPDNSKIVFNGKCTLRSNISKPVVSAAPHQNSPYAYSEHEPGAAQCPPNSTPDPSLTLNGQAIPTVKTLCILEVHYHHDGSGAMYLPNFVSQLAHLSQRICSCRPGLKETDDCRILQAMLISHNAYGTPHHTLKLQEHAKIDVLIRKSYKTALGLPTFTSTSYLLKLQPLGDY